MSFGWDYPPGTTARDLGFGPPEYVPHVCSECNERKPVPMHYELGGLFYINEDEDLLCDCGGRLESED